MWTRAKLYYVTYPRWEPASLPLSILLLSLRMAGLARTPFPLTRNESISPRHYVYEPSDLCHALGLEIPQLTDSQEFRKVHALSAVEQMM